MKQKVLFICVHNSARSQMAAALLNNHCGECFEALSAGLEPGQLNPLAVDVLKELEIDISRSKTRAVFDVWKSAKHVFAYVVSVCSDSEKESCPIFPGVTQRVHWEFPDPSRFQGSEKQRLAEMRRVRDMIHAKVDSFCAEARAMPLQ